MEIGRLVANAREASGLSVRQLAVKACVASSTITRIQSGTVDPSTGTLAVILGAAGFKLTVGAVRATVPPAPRLGDLADAWSIHRGRLRLDWARWRGALDRLDQHPALIPEAIYPPPPPSGREIVDALLAAVAEKLADDVGLQRPSWTSEVPALQHPYRPPVARDVAGRVIPEQLRSRGLMIDGESLWRISASLDG